MSPDFDSTSHFQSKMEQRLSTIDTVKDQSKAFETTQKDLFNQLTDKIHELTKVKDHLFYLINSTNHQRNQSFTSNTNDVNFKNKSEQFQKVYHNLSSIHVELDYLM